MNEELSKAMDLRDEGKLKESNGLLMQSVRKLPEDAIIHYQCAVSFDILGEETKAIPFYKRAIHLGLPKREQERAYLGLGSSLRALGRYEQSKQTLQKAMKLFPENRTIQVFHAMTLYNLKNHDQAMELLLNCIAETTADAEINRYKEAIRFYADKLDQIWE